MTLDARVQGPPAPSAAMQNKTDRVAPVSVKVQAGIVTGEITDMQVMEGIGFAVSVGSQ